MSTKRIKKLFLILTKYVPIVQLISILLNNTLICFGINVDNAIILDFIFGNSIVTSLVLYVTSFALGYCKWYRLLIYCNLINITIAAIDSLYVIPITNTELLATYWSVTLIFILLIIKSKVKKHETNA